MDNKELIELIEYIEENYSRVGKSLSDDKFWCTKEVAEFGSSKEYDYMTTKQMLIKVRQDRCKHETLASAAGIISCRDCGLELVGW